MNTENIKNLSPEERELEKKLFELRELEAKLAECELDLATLQVELHNFEQEYTRVVGVKYTELDLIETQIAEYIAYMESVKDFQPSQNLKKLYREVAKRIHPDLATDKTERKRREKLMAEVNLAYENQDEDKLKNILEEWENSPESVEGEGTAAELIRVIRKISQCMERLTQIKAERKAFLETELYQLKIKVDEAKTSGKDLLAEMSSYLDEQINAAKNRLEELKHKGK
jgi:DnaJ-domain-containing protein 1